MFYPGPNESRVHHVASCTVVPPPPPPPPPLPPPMSAYLPPILVYHWLGPSVCLFRAAATECFCGNDAPDPDWKAGQCNSECTGNKWVACGGRHRINVFKWINGYGDGGSGSSPDDNSRDGSLHQDMYDGATYIGCYEDSRDKRVLGKDDLDKENMTTEVSTQYIKSAHMVGTYPA